MQKDALIVALNEYRFAKEGGRLDFEVQIQNMLDADNVRIRDLRVLLFTLLELVSAVTYDLSLYGEPMSLEEFRPHLHRSIRLLVNDAIME